MKRNCLVQIATPTSGMPMKKKEERIHESLEHLASSNVLLNLLRIRDQLIADLFQFSTIRNNSNRVEDIRARFRHDSKIPHEI